MLDDIACNGIVIAIGTPASVLVIITLAMAWTYAYDRVDQDPGPRLPLQIVVRSITATMRIWLKNSAK